MCIKIRKKIIILTLDVSISGGVERVVSSLANLMVENNDVTILSIFGKKSEIFYYLDNKVEVSYLLNDNFFLSKGLNKVRVHYTIIKNILQFLNCNKDRYEYIISMFDNLSIYSSFSKANNKIIAVQHGDYFAHSKIIRVIRKFRYKKLRAVISLTKHNLKEYHKIKNKNILQIENPLPFEIARNSDLKNKKIIAVGRLVKEKGFENLIEIVTPVLKKYNWTLDIYGEGILKESLTRKIIENKMENYIFLKGNTNYIREKYEQASIYLCSSLTESFSMTLLEAMACGLAVISYDCPNGPRELIDDNINGILVSNQNKDEFSEKLIELLTNQNKVENFGKNAIEKAKNFQGEKILAKWEKLFLDLREKN